MDKKNLLPVQGAPVIRMTAGQLPSHLAELSEEALGGNGLEASATACMTMCAFDGAEASAGICMTMCAFDGAEASATICATMCAFDDAEA